jgi:tripartite-type tricarboxylate transporter receptor subunit TctC
MISRTFLRVAAVLAGTVISMAAVAHTYPDRPVRIVVAAAAGSSPDTIARRVTAKLSPIWGHLVLVENVAGVGGVIGTERVARAAPDGYTLVLSTIGAIAVGPSIMDKMPYDPVKDLEPVSLLMSMPNLLVVHPSVPVKTVGELVAYVKANPDKLQYGHPGIGTTPHLAAELLKRDAGIAMPGIPYTSSAQMTTDLLGGHYQVLFHNSSVVLPHVKSGALRVLGMTGDKRSPAMPDIPTVAEAANFPGFEVSAWWGLYAPAGTPAAIVSKISADVAAALAQPDVKEWVEGQAGTVGGGTPADLRDHQAAETRKWQELVKAANLKPTN